MSAPKWSWLVVITVIAISMSVWTKQPGRIDASDTVETVPAPARSRQSPAVPISENVRGPALAIELPPADAKVVDIIDALKRRSAAGDGHAACRLAVDLLECRTVLNMALLQPDHGQDAESKFEREGNAAAANYMAQMKLGKLLAERRCEGVTQQQIAQAPGLLRQAALTGVNEAMVRYAEGMGVFNDRQLFSVLREPAFDVWRREAPALIQQALQQGDTASVVVLYGAYSDDLSFFAGLVPDDPVKTYSFRRLIGLLHGNHRDIPSTLEPTLIRRGEEDAARMHRDYFNSAILPKDVRLGSMLTPSWVYLGQPGSQRQSCQ